MVETSSAVLALDPGAVRRHGEVMRHRVAGLFRCDADGRSPAVNQWDGGAALGRREQDGRAVAVCASVRISGQGHETGVETDPAYRRRGYATRAVAAWSQEVKRRGVPLCFYSTSWENDASRHVAARLGLTLMGADFSIA